MKPYYHDEQCGITIYHGDCREVLPTLSPVDLVLTDPPYGIASVWKGGSGHGWNNARAQSIVRNDWDAAAPSDELLTTCVSKGSSAIVWGGNHFSLPPSRSWLVWNKPERNFSLAEAELAWTNLDTVVRVYDYRRSDPDREHPTQKPLSLMKWCILRCPKAQTILDPFMGSGTTLVAAKQLNRRAVGIEVNEEYCQQAVRRLSQGVLELV